MPAPLPPHLFPLITPPIPHHLYALCWCCGVCCCCCCVFAFLPLSPLRFVSAARLAGDCASSAVAAGFCCRLTSLLLGVPLRSAAPRCGSGCRATHRATTTGGIPYGLPFPPCVVSRPFGLPSLTRHPLAYASRAAPFDASARLYRAAPCAHSVRYGLRTLFPLGYASLIVRSFARSLAPSPARRSGLSEGRGNPWFPIAPLLLPSRPQTLRLTQERGSPPSLLCLAVTSPRRAARPSLRSW